MDFIDLSYVQKSAVQKYERDLDACRVDGKVQPDLLAQKIYEIDDRLGDGYTGMVGHNLDRVKTLDGLSDKHARLLEQCLILAHTIQSLVIYGRSQNMLIHKLMIDLTFNELDREYFTKDTDPDRYARYIADEKMDGVFKPDALSARFMRFAGGATMTHHGGLYGRLHQAFEYAFAHYLVPDDFNRGIKKELETFFKQEAIAAWNARKGDVPVLIRHGDVITPQ